MQTYLLKLARSGEEGEKVFLLIESGTRFHTTEVGLAAALTCKLGSNTLRLCSISILQLQSCLRAQTALHLSLSRPLCTELSMSERMDLS